MLNEALSLKEDEKKVRDVSDVCEEITDEDRKNYFKVISTKLTKEQEEMVLTPPQSYPRLDAVIALHWHPEFIPMPLIKKRIEASFPNKKKELIIPTQHNVLNEYGNFAGVEVDCYSPEFNRKVQLLLHFEKSAVKEAPVLKSMLNHTLKYRASQLFELIAALTDEKYADSFNEVVKITGAGKRLIKFIKVYTKKVEMLIHENESVTPEES
ncbi:MAG: hypothetical protein HQK84_11530, partial [Nitrospinae bacterium]|nr:hypothetical protein [Nitrospinota bacterium]